MEHTKLGTNEDKPAGEATVTTGMQRDRDSVDDFEHLDRESSPVDKVKKNVGEFESRNPSDEVEEKFKPKMTLEEKLAGLPDSYSAIADEWAAQTKSLIESSGLESFLRNEKGFMSSEMNVSPGLDELKTDSVPKTSSTDKKDNDAFAEQLFGGQEKLTNTQFIATEVLHDFDKQALLGKSDSDSSPNTDFESSDGPGKIVEGFDKTSLFADDFGQDTLTSQKIAENIPTVDVTPSSIINDVAKPTEPVEFVGTDDQLLEDPTKHCMYPYNLIPDPPTHIPQRRWVTGPSDDNLFNQPLEEDPADEALWKEAYGYYDEDVVEPTKEIAADEITEPMEIFCKMGLDAWFKPERLHPTVVELVYWRDPKKSGVVFGTVLGVLLSLSYFSLISVIAYLSLAVLSGTIAYRIYKNIIQAVQKTSDGHPFKEILDLDLTLPQDKVRELTDMTVNHLNAAAVELRRLFLVEDLVDSIKFGVLLWCMTYVGSWFNGMTIIIIMFVAMFTLPKVYENNKTQIDQNLEIVRGKLAEISAKVKAAVPIGKKPVEEKKEQ